MHCCPADFHSPPKEERRRGSLNLAFNKSLYCSWPRPAAPAPLNAAPANPAKKSLTAFAATATAPCCLCPTSSSDCFISPFAVFIGIRNTAAELELPELEAAELGLLELGATELKLLELEAAKLELPELEASELELPELEAAELELLELGATELELPELKATELELPELELLELATRPEPASPPVAAKGGRGEAKTDAGAGARERRGEGAERGTPPPPPLPLSPLPLPPPSLSSLSPSQSPPPLLCCAAAPPLPSSSASLDAHPLRQIRRALTHLQGGPAAPDEKRRVGGRRSPQQPPFVTGRSNFVCELRCYIDREWCSGACGPSPVSSSCNMGVRASERARTPRLKLVCRCSRTSDCRPPQQQKGAGEQDITPTRLVFIAY